jgi:tape measure domain-containing protein|nr:MAG TPA: tail tape measure [Caudoviricetes sp.]
MKREIAKELGGVDVTGSTSSWGSRLGESLTRGIGGAIETIGKIGLGATAAAVGGIGAALGAYIPEAIKASDATDKFQNTLKFAGVDPGKIKDLTAAAQTYADKTIYDLQDIQSMTSKLAANGVKGFDKLAEAAGNLTAAAGGGKNEFAAFGYAMVQVNAAGRLMTQDWNQIANAIPGGAGKIMQALKDMGAYTGDFRDAMAKGKISAEDFNKAIMSLGFDEVAIKAAQSATTFEGAWGNLEASLNKELTGSLREVKKPMTELINAVADNLVPQLGEKLAPAAQSAAGWIQRLADSVKSGETNIKSLKGQLEAVTGGFGAMLAAGAGLKNFQQIAGFFGGLDGALGKASGSVVDFAKGMPEAGKSLASLKNLPGEVTGAFGQMSKRVASARFEMTGVSDGFFDTLFGGTRLGSALSAANGKLSSGMGVLKGTVSQSASFVGRGFEGVAERMAPAVSRIGGVASSIGGKITGPLAPIGARVRGAFAPLGAAFDGFGAKLSGLAPKASQSLGKLGGLFAPGRMLKVLSFGGLAAAAFAGIGAIVQQGGVELVAQIGKTLQGLPGQIALYGEKIAQSLPEALATGTNIVTMVINAITQSMPQLSNAFGKIVPALVKGLSDALPVLLPAVAQMITAITTALVENAPMLIESGLQLLQGLVDGIFAALPVLISALPQIIQTFMNGFLQALPRILEMGTQLLQSIIDGILQTLPVLIAMLPQIITTVINGLVQALPQIIQAGVGMLNALINGLIQAIPMLIEALPTIITTIVDTLLNNLPQIIEAGIQLLIGVITGIVQAIPQLIAMLPQIIVTIVTTLVQNIPKIISAGIQILVGLVTGIVQAIPQIGGAIAQVGSSIMSAVAGFPRMLFESGKKIISGLIDGIKSMFSSAKNAVSGFLSGIRNLLPFSPAKEGPFSGHGWTLYSGMSIAEALADGMQRRGHLFKEAVADTLAEGQAQIRDLEAGQLTAVGAYRRASMMSDWTLGKTQSARELVVRDVNDQLVGRMRVEAYGVTGDALGSVSRGSLRERIGISR